MIWNFVINEANKNVIKIPPKTLNFAVTASKKNTIPKYIGFLEYLKAPEMTNEEAFFIAIGLIVVSCFLKELTAEPKVTIPKIKKISPIASNIPLLKSGNNGLEK